MGKNYIQELQFVRKWGLINDKKKYEESLHNLHNEYETNKKQLDKYLTLSEMK